MAPPDPIPGPSATGPRGRRRRHYGPGQQQIRADRRVSEPILREEPDGTKHKSLWDWLTSNPASPAGPSQG